MNFFLIDRGSVRRVGPFPLKVNTPMAGSIRLHRNEFPDGQLSRSAGGILWEYAGEEPTLALEPRVKLLRRGDASTIKIISMNAVPGRGLFEPVG